MQQFLTQFTVAVAVIGSVFASASFAESASAASGLSASLRTENPLKSSLVLTNKSDSTCQVVNSATGTVAITKLSQGGTPITPTPMDTSFQDDPELMLRSQLKTLSPGQSVEIPLRATKSGDKIALRPVTWSPTGGTVGTLYLVKANTPIAMEVSYSIPIEAAPGTPPMCDDTQVSTLSSTLTPKNITLLVAIVIALVVLCIIFLLLKHHKKKPVAAAILMIAAAAGLISSTAPVRAQITVPDEVQPQWDSCLETLSRNNDITRPILDLIDDPSVRIIVDPTTTGWTESGSKWPDGTYHIDWNVNDGHRYFGTGGNEDSCTSIYHELYHILDQERGTFSREDCAGSGLETKEVMATRAQNLLRVRLGMPPRSHYGRTALPTGDCRATPPPPPCHGTCGRSTGDPHLRTLDGHYYDFQAAGEFTLAKTTDDAFDIQVRQQPWNNSRIATITTAAAIKAAGQTIEVSITDKKISLIINGKSQPIAPQKLGDLALSTLDNNNRIDLAIKDGSSISIYRVGNYGLDIWVSPDKIHMGKMAGLLGDFDEKRDNDIRIKGKSTALSSDSDALYPAYADSWRISDGTSYFTYPASKTTASYTDRAFPYDKPERNNLPGYKAAEAICKQRGITEPVLLANCAFDVAITGRPEFIRSAQREQSVTLGSQTGESYIMNTPQPSSISKVPFTAKKDEKVFVDIYSSTFPAICGNFTIRDSADKELSSGCIINGKGYVETTTIPADGTYTLQLRATEEDTGEARVKLYRITDQTAAIKPDGNAATALINKPGMQAHFTFTAEKGQRFFLNVPKTTLPSQCTPLSITSPSGNDIANGCLINGKGMIDTFIAPESGQHTVTLNPVETSTGSATLRLTTAYLETKTITLGASTKLQFKKPGNEAEIRFNGSAGQRIYIDMRGSTLPSQCGGIELRMPNGQKEGGCIIGSSDSFADKGIVLPVNGTYIFSLSPIEANTGDVTIQIRK